MKFNYDPSKSGYVWVPKHPSRELSPVKAVACPNQRLYRRASRAERIAYDKPEKRSRR